MTKEIQSREPFTGRKVRYALGALSYEALRLIRSEHSQKNKATIQNQIDTGSHIMGLITMLSKEIKRRDNEIERLQNEH